ncbi:MAG: phospho-sugar mutase [Bacteroidetes bacterium]|nr:MAG: phospho-sugar mutase [Bacteroidota bacterium]
MSLNSLDPTTRANVQSWLNGNYDAETKAEIQRLLDAGAVTELTDAFYKDLEFGTGGMRGVMGVGSNRINRYTLGMATQGFANYLRSQYPDTAIKVVIAHDSRNNSTAFANLVAEVFAANDIYVYYFDGLRPTPELSYAIRLLACQGGVMLTASHNPREYNGYKAYGADGGQLTPPHDQGVMDEVRKIGSIDEVKFKGEKENIELIGTAVDEKYLAELVSLSINREAIRRQHDLKIVYSPIHGTGRVLVPPVLEHYGFTHVHLVEEQMTIDGNFPTVVYPNPEEEEALTLALRQAEQINADLVMATDPDADRVGIAIPGPDGKFMLVNGNQTASLLVHYVLTAWEQANKLTGKEYIVKTIVTSYLLDAIAKSKGVECFNTLTGFKWIGQIITQLEGQKTFLCGGEESYGYLVGEHARDKDAVVSCAIIAEMAAYYKDQGRSLYEALVDIYLEYGCYQEKLIAITKKGKRGAEEIAAMMAGFRQQPPQSLGGAQVVMIKDYLAGTAKDLRDGRTEQIDLPASNVLQFLTEDGSIISARPSGTEPKIKFYCSVNAPLSSREAYPAVQAELSAKVDRIMEDLRG